MSLPSTYKAAVLETAGVDLVFKELPLEKPKTGEILVRVIATGVCHGDCVVKEGGFPVPLPIILGHETIGEVAAIPVSEDHWKVGDRVGAPWHGGHCGFCRECKRGLFQMCVSKTVNGVFRNGGFAEFMTLRRESAVHIPDAVDPVKFAPLLCAGVTVFNGIRQLNVRAGELVAIQGIGGLGHLAIQYAAKLGYRVVVLSRGKEKEPFAVKLGASKYIDTTYSDGTAELQAMGGAALIVTTAPTPKAISPLPQGLQPGGKLLVLGAAGTVPFDTNSMLFNALSIHGWPSGSSLDSEEAVLFAEHHNINCMISTYPLSEANRALADTAEGKTRFRAVLKM